MFKGATSALRFGAGQSLLDLLDPCPLTSEGIPLTLTVNARRLALPRFMRLALGLLCLLEPLAAQVPDTGQTTTRGPVLRDALIVDADQSGNIGAGDELWLVFDQALVLANPAGVALLLPVAGDALGAGAAASHVSGRILVVALGGGAVLKSRQDFAPSDLNSNSPSGVALSPDTAAGALIGAKTGLSAVTGAAVDIRPWFTTAPFAGFGLATEDLLARDLDGDGDEDVLAHPAGGLTRVWTSFFGGSFAFLGQTLGTTLTSALATADLDDDGDLDVIEARSGIAATNLWLNNGTGTFTLYPITLPATGVEALLVSDFDGDGLPDLVTAKNPGSNLVWILERDYSFYMPGLPYGPGAEALCAADFDRDGDLDFASGNPGAPNVLWSNAGDGTFAPGAIGDPLTAHNTLDLVAADLDLDGDSDLVEVGSGSEGLYTLENDGVGSFQQVAAGALTPGTQRALRAEDLDQDGDADLLVVLGGLKSEVWWNVAAALQRSAVQLPATGGVAAAVGHLDGDGDLDVLLGDLGGADRLLWGSSQAGFGSVGFQQTGQVFFPRPSEDLALADFDVDGDLDFAVANDGYLNQSYVNDGAAFFTLKGFFGGAESSTRAIASADVDGDGQSDLVTGDRFVVPSIQVLLHAFDGFFGLHDAFGADSCFAQLLADLDSDGDADLVTGAEGLNRIRFNDGHGNFSYTGIAFGSAPTLALAAGDVDGDGDLDLAEGNIDGPDRVLLNLGGGFMADSGQDLGFDSTSSVAFADLEGDGDADLVIGRTTTPDVVWRNAGGVFSLAQSLADGSTSDLALGDVDGDGDPDLVQCRPGFNGTAVYLNDGTGHFVEPGTLLSSHNPESVSIGDLDQDGDLDFLSACSSAPHTIWLNE